MIQLYIIGGLSLVLATVIGGGKLYIDELQAEKATMTQAYGIAAQTAIDNKAQLDQEIAEHKRVDGILLTRELALRKLEATNDLLNTALDNLKRTDPKVRKWDDTAVPDALRSLLNGPTASAEGSGDQAVPAVQPDAGDAPADGLYPH